MITTRSPWLKWRGIIHKQGRFHRAHCLGRNVMALSVILVPLLLGFTPSYAQDSSLELRLNNVTHAIIDPTNFQIDTKDIPLQSLFPYLESVEYLEVKFGRSSMFWDATSLGSTGWDGALLTFRDQTWVLRVNSNSFTAPRYISVHGIRKAIGLVQIWSSIQNPQYKTNLSAALALRDVKVKWKDVNKLANRLDNPPPQGMPHLVIVDQLHMLRLGSLLTSPCPIMARLSRWYFVSQSGSNSGRIAINAYQPESALLYLLADNPNLFDKHNQLPDSLISFLSKATMSDGLMVSAHPMAALANSADSRVTGSVRLPSSQEEEIDETFVEAEPPAEAVNIIRYIYATIPANIGSEQRKLAKLVLEDAARLADLVVPVNAVVIPRHPRVLRFFDAYTRIGRLAISNQITATKAAELINAYTAGE